MTSIPEDNNVTVNAQLPEEQKHAYHIIESKPYVLLDMDSFVSQCAPSPEDFAHTPQRML